MFISSHSRLVNVTLRDIDKHKDTLLSFDGKLPTSSYAYLIMFIFTKLQEGVVYLTKQAQSNVICECLF